MIYLGDRCFLWRTIQVSISKSKLKPFPGFGSKIFYNLNKLIWTSHSKLQAYFIAFQILYFCWVTNKYCIWFLWISCVQANFSSTRSCYEKGIRLTQTEPFNWTYAAYGMQGIFFILTVWTFLTFSTSDHDFLDYLSWGGYVFDGIDYIITRSEALPLFWIFTFNIWIN